MLLRQGVGGRGADEEGLQHGREERPKVVQSPLFVQVKTFKKYIFFPTFTVK